jgi:hypothetical protein
MQTLVLLSLIALAKAAATVDYVRPINQDCVSTASGDVSLFPKQFMVAGEVSPKESSTEVRFHLLSIIASGGFGT